MSNTRCDNCKFWFEPLKENSNDEFVHPDDYAGDCRRYPPARNMDLSPEQRAALQWPADGFEFPMSAGGQWCGEFKPA